MDGAKTRDLIGIILKGIGLAMGIAVFVLSILGSIENDTSIKLLSLGVVAYGLYLLQDKK
ncbi:hypothetical protein CIW83_04585 [Tissierella sp. P1]|jgi:hypothetical protein|uniref:hypothetical protein n=1 Tax=unclassified Tissierella TaxID=2638726 RepID=UPI000B9FF654|nr:hypothetical protein [Tissierella sp. P1]MDU5080201.1 hypothetical protein [Bacillota bacterium]OZV13158.1 hypothetical protein CIW83_04585 [Tissierella sp. P1]